jgi:tRNA (guanosine-2'-O-)-methyltransferase
VPTKERIEKVKKVLSMRQPDLRIVLEEVKNTHNASAVARTCDAAGILYLDIISASKEPFPVNEAISTRAEKWIQFNYYTSTSDCLKQLKKKGFKIAATHLSKDALPYTALDYTQPLALVFGNEAEGISDEALSLTDFKIKIPMIGMAQSLNLSVSVGIILYEAMIQRQEKGFYKKGRLSSDEFEKYMEKWLGSSSNISSKFD